MCKMVQTIRQRLKDIAGDCSGATAVEYAVLLGLIVLVGASAIQAIGQSWTTVIFAKLNLGLEKTQ